MFLHRCHGFRRVRIITHQQRNNSNLNSLTKKTYNLNIESPSQPLEFINSYSSNSQENRKESIKELLTSMKQDKSRNFIKFVQLLNQVDHKILIQIQSDIHHWKEEFDKISSEELNFMKEILDGYQSSSKFPILLKQLTWEQCNSCLIEKIIEYEQVHPFSSWIHIKQRMSLDRRCFALFENVNWNDPLIFVWVALTTKVPSSILDLLPLSCFQHIHPNFKRNSDSVFSIRQKNEANTAVFYSINSSGKGQSGIGNLLIKEACKPLLIEFPSKFFFLFMKNDKIS